MTIMSQIVSTTQYQTESSDSKHQSKQIRNDSKLIIKTKFDNDSPNEFTNGYFIRLPELIVIGFILMLWILALRKFFKNFDKIRTTHYREIPYKYRIKDPENLNQVRICHYPSQGVIFTNDPVANVVSSRQYSLCQDIIMSPKHSLNRQLSTDPSKKFNIYISEAEDNSISSLEPINKSFLFDDDIEYIDNANSNEILIKNDDNQLQSNSLNNLKTNPNKKLKISKRQDDSSLDERIYHRFYSTDQKRLLFKNDKNTTFSLQKKFYIDHLTVSPVIKKSIFDLHKRSLEKMSRVNSAKSGHDVNVGGGNGGNGEINATNPFIETKHNSLNTNLSQTRAKKMSKIRYSDCTSLKKKFSFKKQSSESFL